MSKSKTYIKLDCGCQFKGTSSNAKWTRCTDAQVLLQNYIKSLNIKDRNKYFEHYKSLT